MAKSTAIEILNRNTYPVGNGCNNKARMIEMIGNIINKE